MFWRNKESLVQLIQINLIPLQTGSKVWPSRAKPRRLSSWSEVSKQYQEPLWHFRIGKTFYQGMNLWRLCLIYRHPVPFLSGERHVCRSADDLVFRVRMSNCWPVPAWMFMVPRHPVRLFCESVTRVNAISSPGDNRRWHSRCSPQGFPIIWWESESRYIRDVRLAGLVAGMTAAARTRFVGINADGATKDYIRFPTQKEHRQENHLHSPRYKSRRCRPKREIKTVKSRQINCLK